MRKDFTIISLIICLFATNLLGGCSTPNAKISKSGFYFDTIITITLMGSSNEKLIDQCFELADKYDKILSASYEGSEISQINSHAGKEAVTVSDETIELIQKSIDFGKLSQGKFDITIGKISELWNFSDISKELDQGNIADATVLPDSAKLSELTDHVDYRKIIIEGNTVFLSDSDCKLDLGGIAKGFIADKMKSYLNSAGIKSGIINLGGNILTIGPKTDSSNYTIGIQYPFDEEGQAIATLSLSDKSVVTSGVYERYYYVNDVLYHHLINPEDGYPFDTGLNSVTIVSDASIDGDALSTICFGMGLDAGIDFIENMDNIEAVFVDQKNKVHYTSGLENNISIK